MSRLVRHQPHSVLIADDHAVVRRGLRQVIAEVCEGVLVEEVGSGQAVIDAVRRQEWMVVILDINLPDKNGLDVLKDVRVFRPALPVLILSLHAEAQYAARAYKAGASGYLTKDSASNELACAIRKVAAGGRYVSPSFAENLAGHLTGDVTVLPHQTLSDREYQVFCLLAKGKTVSAIAEQQSLSVNTISTYRARILRKLQLQTNADLMRYAFDHRLVE